MTDEEIRKMVEERLAAEKAARAEAERIIAAEKAAEAAQPVVAEPTPVEEQPTAALQVAEPTVSKSITEIGVNDIKLNLDQSKNVEEQAEQVVGAMAIVKAVQDEEVAQAITDQKAKELLNKADMKAKRAKTDNTAAEVAMQEAERSKYENVLKLFAANKHIPDKLLKIMVMLFSPVYIALHFIIGLPVAIVKTVIKGVGDVATAFIECTDNILVRYESADEKRQPKIRATVWVVLGLAIVGAICLTILGCLHII